MLTRLSRPPFPLAFAKVGSELNGFSFFVRLILSLPLGGLCGGAGACLASGKVRISLIRCPNQTLTPA